MSGTLVRSLKPPAESFDGGWRYPSAVTAWAAVAVFALAQIVSTIDRGMLALVVDPIRHDIRISDVQIALLQGLAFAIFYVLVGLPLGLVADLVNRRRLLIVAVLGWSAATAACGLAQTFGQMFAARLLVGLGEAALAPCAVTMIGDLFPSRRRGPPMALYILGSMVAVGIGSLVTGAILDAAPKGAFDIVPLFRHRAPWRTAFLIVGASGLVVAALVFCLKEPPRQGLTLKPREGLGLAQASAYLAQHWPVFAPFYGAVAAYAVGSSVAVNWGASLLSRSYGLSPASVGKALGGGQLIAALAGALCAGLVIDRVVRRAGIGGKMLLATAIPLLAIPSATAWLAGNSGLAVAMLSEVMFVGALFGSTMLSTTTELVPANMKGVSVALYAFVVTMVGGVVGPLAVAQLNQTLFGDPRMIGRSMAMIGVSSLLLSSVLALVARWRIARAFAANDGLARVLAANVD